MTLVTDEPAVASEPDANPAGVGGWPTAPGDAAVRASLVVIATVTGVAALYVAQAVLFPIAFAVGLNLVFKPVTRRLTRWGLPSTLSAAVVFLAFALLVAFLVLTLSQPAHQWLSDAPQTLRGVREKLRPLYEPLSRLTAATRGVEDLAQLGGRPTGATVAVQQPFFAGALLSSTTSVLASVTTTALLLFFLMAAGDRFLEKLVGVFPRLRDKVHCVSVFREVEARIARYLGAITVINFGLGAAVAASMWLLGLPNPLLWGFVAGVLNYIPFLGMVIGSSMIFAVAVVSFESLGAALLAPLTYIVLNGIEGNLITPSLLGRSIELNPVVIILSVVVWGWMWGIGGVLLAVPMLLVAKIVCEEFEALRPIGVFLEP